MAEHAARHEPSSPAWSCRCGHEEPFTSALEMSSAFQAHRARVRRWGVDRVVLAVVGSTRFEKDRRATLQAVTVIDAALDRYEPVRVVSGGAAGIDTLARNRAEARGIEVVEHLPKFPRWAPEGYMDRNDLIATDCTHLLRVKHHASRTYGSGWTADRAEKLGRHVDRVEIGPADLFDAPAWAVDVKTGGLL